MLTHNVPTSVRSGCSKFTLMKKNPKASHLQFFKQNANLTYQSDLNNTKTRQGSKNQTKSMQKDKSLGFSANNDKIIFKASLNRTKKEMDELAPSLNTKLIKLFKTLDLAKKKKIASTNRTTFEKSHKKNQLKSNTNNKTINEALNKNMSLNHGTTRSTKKNNAMTTANHNTIQIVQQFTTGKVDQKQTRASIGVVAMPQGKKNSEENIKKQLRSKVNFKDKSKETVKTFNQFNIGYMKSIKPKQPLKVSVKANKATNNKYLYLSTNQSNIQNGNQHNSNRTIEQIFSLRPTSKAQPDIKWINTTGDYYGPNREDHDYDSDSNNLIRDEDDSDDKQEDSGVLAYDDVKDIIVYNNFEELSRSNSNLFDEGTYEGFIQCNKDRLALKFCNDKGNKKEHKSPSTHESSHNKKNYVNIIKYSG